jgi:hypothetical protein
MRHGRPRLHGVLVGLLFALGAMFVVVGAASLTSRTADSPAGAAPRTIDGTRVHHDAVPPRVGPSSTSKDGVHVDAVAVLGAGAIGSLPLLGWLVATRRRDLLPRLVTRSSGARAPPALV